MLPKDIQIQREEAPSEIYSPKHTSDIPDLKNIKIEVVHIDDIRWSIRSEEDEVPDENLAQLPPK